MERHPIYGDFEEWRDIPGYEGHYQASNWGSIRSLERTVSRTGRSTTITHHGISLKLYRNEKGYWRVSISKDGRTRRLRVSRLVALTWVPNPNNLPEVNHDDLNKDNNHYKNFSWNTRLQNMQHAFKNRKIKRYRNEEHWASKKVEQYDLSGTLIKMWPSANETGRNGFDFTRVARVCRGERKTYKGFIWKYAS